MRLRSIKGAMAVAVAAVSLVLLSGSILGGLGDDSIGSSSHSNGSHRATETDVRATSDRFGIDYLEPTLPDGTIWLSNWEKPRDFNGVDPEDNWFDADHGSASYRTGQGVLRISGAIPRMYIHDPRMQRQWGDVEVTMYFKRVGDANVPYAGMSSVARSNHLDTESGTNECDTRGIGGRFRYDGHVDFEKETAFPFNEATHNRVLFPGGMPYGRWIGYKYLVYDKPDGVHLELWVDLTDGRNGGSWRRVDSMVDDGYTFGVVPCAKGVYPQMALTRAPHRYGSETGKPNLTVYFRSDGVHRNGLLYKWGSVREIRAR